MLVGSSFFLLLKKQFGIRQKRNKAMKAPQHCGASKDCLKDNN